VVNEEAEDGWMISRGKSAGTGKREIWSAVLSAIFLMITFMAVKDKRLVAFTKTKKNLKL